MSYETMEKEGVARRGFVVVIARAVESEVPIFDSGQFQLSDSYSIPTPSPDRRRPSAVLVT